jgi:copper chaperone
MTTTTYPVTGMSCEHCVTAVTSELGSIGGVSGVTVILEPGGISRVTVASDAPLPMHAVSGALDAAGGYQISEG